MIDNYTYIIIALLPLSALMLVTQVNPYHALVIRAILGAVAAIVYAVLGAADVALTEALVGTMLAVTLYVIAVRSSLVMRLGILEEDKETQGRGGDESKQNSLEKDIYLQELIASLRTIIKKHHLRLELVQYPNLSALETALGAKEVHGVCTKQKQLERLQQNSTTTNVRQTYKIAIRVRRLFEIMQGELIPETTLTYVAVPNMEEKH